jgi:hypothetical protein
MKTLKHLALAVLVVAGLLVPLASSRPQSASAAPPDNCYLLSSVFFLGFSGYCPGASGYFADTTSCALQNVRVSATADGNTNTYNYDLACNYFDFNTYKQANAPILHVLGRYSLDTKIAAEQLRTDELLITANWICPHDPWDAPSAVSCRLSGEMDLTHTGIVGSFNVTNQISGPQPVSVLPLDDDARLVLFQAQLKYAAAHPAAPAPNFVQVVESPTFQKTNCAICSALGTTPAPAPGK